MSSIWFSRAAIPAAFFSIGFAACGGGESPSGGGGESADCTVTGVGTLVVNVEGLPAGIAGKVAITGPSGPESLSQTRTFASAEAGSYTASAEKVTQPDPIVRTVYSPTLDVSTVCLGDAATQTVTVSYEAVPTSNKLWLSNGNSPNNTTVEGFASESLGESGSPEATVAATSPGGGHVLFDKDGNLSVSGSTSPSVSVSLRRRRPRPLNSDGAIASASPWSHRR